MPPPQAAQSNVPKKKTNVVMIVVLSICLGLCLCTGVLAAIILPAFAQAKEAAKVTACARNMSEVGKAIEKYAAETGSYPPTMDESYSYAPTPNMLKCVEMEKFGYGLGYTYNAPAFANKKVQEVDANTLATQPLLTEVLGGAVNLVLDPTCKFAKRHSRGRYVNAYYVGRGVVKLKLTDQQIETPIMQALKEIRPAR